MFGQEVVMAVILSLNCGTPATLNTGQVLNDAGCYIGGLLKSEFSSLAM